MHVAWCCHNRLTPHPDKTEYMIMSRRKFIGPLQCLKLGESQIKRVESKVLLHGAIFHATCLAMQVARVIAPFNMPCNGQNLCETSCMKHCTE